MAHGGRDRKNLDRAGEMIQSRQVLVGSLTVLFKGHEMNDMLLSSTSFPPRNVVGQHLV